MKEEIILGLIKTGKDVGKKALDWVKTEEGKQFFCGTYTDGSTRSFRDAWNDEVMSPKTRKKRMKEIEKRRKLYEEMVLGKPKKKKKHKKKKKKSKKGNDFPHIDFTAF